jgi:small subunit ribosomal protein S8
MTDPIADMLIRIKNAQAANHKSVRVPFSNLKYALAKILEKRGFVGDIDKRGKDVLRYIKINLQYRNNLPAISDVKRVSKPGQRIYIKKTEIRLVKQGCGIAVISTPKGLMTGEEAKKEGLGGELICEVW